MSKPEDKVNLASWMLNNFPSEKGLFLSDKGIVDETGKAVSRGKWNFIVGQPKKKSSNSK